MSGEAVPRSDLRVETRFKNARLFNAIVDRYEMLISQGSCVRSRHANSIGIPEISVLSGVSVHTIYDLLNMKSSPFRADGFTYRDSCNTLASVLGEDVNDLFPASLYALNLPGVVVKEFCSPELLSLQSVRALAAPEQVEFTDIPERNRLLRDAIGTLNTQQGRVIELRFGLDGNGERTLEDIARTLGITRERVRQIEARALRLLRNPASARGLRPFLEIVQRG